MANMDTAIKRRSAMLIGMPYRPINLNGTAATAARAMGLYLYAGIAFSGQVITQLIQMLTLQRIGD